MSSVQKQREFELGEREFQRLRQLVWEHSGISLSDAKRELVYSRLAKRVRALGLTGFRDYCQLLEEGHAEELGHFVNAITTNLTSFFRENHHFDYLTQTALPHLFAARAGSRRLRIWSAGCSTGEEPYSLAITLLEHGIPAGWDVKILATDLDSNVVATGRAGVYDLARVSGLPQARLKRWFLRGSGPNSGRARVSSRLAELITFRQLNLLHPWPMSGSFDIIFCRNVVIYFDKPTQKTLFERYAGVLADDGYLFKVTDAFRLTGNTIYRKAVGRA